MRRLVLFDIDNTLISIGSGNLPQRRAMNAAFERAHGIPDAFEGVPFTGGMDLPLMMEVYQKRGLIPEGSEIPPDMSAFKAAYFEGLARNLDDWLGGSICHGEPDLLAALDADPRAQLGLETGNFREAAFIKLGRYGLDGFFQEGGFGGDHMEKRQVVVAAIERCQEVSGLVYGAGELFVVGDTPSDVEAGKVYGAETIAVATGFYSAEDLAKCRPSHVLPDLSDTRTVPDLIFRLGGLCVGPHSEKGVQPA